MSRKSKVEKVRTESRGLGVALWSSWAEERGVSAGALEQLGSPGLEDFEPRPAGAEEDMEDSDAAVSLTEFALDGSFRALRAAERRKWESCGEHESGFTASRPGRRGLKPCRRHRSCSSSLPPSASPA